MNIAPSNFNSTVLAWDECNTWWISPLLRHVAKPASSNSSTPAFQLRFLQQVARSVFNPKDRIQTFSSWIISRFLKSSQIFPKVGIHSAPLGPALGLQVYWKPLSRGIKPVQSSTQVPTWIQGRVGSGELVRRASRWFMEYPELGSKTKYYRYIYRERDRER